MGLSLSKLGKNDLRVLLLGLDSAGKSTILYKLKLDETLNTIPTVGFNVETIKYKKMNLNVWDVGGQDSIRSLWRHYYTGTHALIFVIDCADADRIEQAREEFTKIVNDREMKESIILIYANKQDLKGALLPQEIPEILGLDRLGQRSWIVQPSCATSGDGLEPGLDWLLSETKKIRKMKKSQRS
jgi:ADP-ribosylation factor protein 6